MIAESSKVSALRKSTQSQTAPKKKSESCIWWVWFLNDEDSYFVKDIWIYFHWNNYFPGKTQKYIGFLVRETALSFPFSKKI